MRYFLISCTVQRQMLIETEWQLKWLCEPIGSAKRRANTRIETRRRCTNVAPNGPATFYLSWWIYISLLGSTFNNSTGKKFNENNEAFLARAFPCTHGVHFIGSGVLLFLGLERQKRVRQTRVDSIYRLLSIKKFFRLSSSFFFFFPLFFSVVLLQMY